MNHYRNRDPNHPAARKLRNRPDRGGPIADQETDDGGSADAELTDAAEDMFDFAQRTRKEREARLHGGDVKKRAAKRKTK